MSADNLRLSARLSDLAGLSLRKKYRLTKSEQKECIEVLSSMIELSIENAKKALVSLPELPSDVGVVVLVSMWDHLQRQKLPINKILRSTQFSSGPGKRLRLALGCQLLTYSPRDALSILVDICQDMKPDKKVLPTMTDLKLISTTLLVKGHTLLHKLPLTNGKASQVQLLVVYFLAAGFLAKNKGKTICSQEVQLVLLRWTKALIKLSDIPSELAVSITGAIRSWSDKNRKSIASEIDSLHKAIREAVETAIFVERPGAVLHPVMNSKVQKDQFTPQYDPLIEIRRLAEHLKQQDKLFKDIVKQLRQSKRDCDVKRSELERARQNLGDFKRLLAIEGEKLDAARKEQEQLMLSRDEVVERLKNKKVELENIETQYKTKLQSYDKQLDILSERIAREGDHRVKIFQNKLKSKLRTYGQSLREVGGMEMTEELGKRLRVQLKQIIKILKSEGIDIEESK